MLVRSLRQVASGLTRAPLPQGGLTKAFEPLFGWMALRYQAVVGKELRKYGLRYEDLFDPQQDLVRSLRGAGWAGLITCMWLLLARIGVCEVYT